jgi:hypothetical protein
MEPSDHIERSAPVPSAPPAGRRSLPMSTVVVGVIALAFAGLWLSARSDANDARSELDAIEAVADAEAAAAAELPDLKELAANHRFTSTSNAESASQTSLSLTFSKYESLDELEKLLVDDLAFGPAIMDRIGNTRALDGTLTATAPHATASWTYHPDNGLNIVIERTD